jgi:hypothetical protein
MKALVLQFRSSIRTLTATLVLILTSQVLSGQWYDLAWQYRVPVTVTNSGSALTDFQVRVELDESFTWDNASADGSDIRVTDALNADLPFWIERWNPAGDEAVIWVRMPSVPAGNTPLYVYYGNGAASGVSNGTATFKFYDDFRTTSEVPGRWMRTLVLSGGVWGTTYAPHDWKYCMEMQQGALYYAIANAQNSWSLTSLDTEIEQEFDYIHSRMNPDGTVIADSYLTAEPQYCYGVLMSNLALGYLYFENSNPSLAGRCYDDLQLLFDYLRVTYPTVGSTSDAGGYAMLLHGYSNAWKAFTDTGNTTSAGQALTIIQSYTTTFINTQGAGGNWQGADGVQEHLKRNFGMLKAYEVTGTAGYLTAVRNNIDYIIANFWIPANGGLEWYVGGSSNRFFECHQQWFMTAVRLLYDLSGGTYNYLTYAEAAWHFLTDNNNALGTGGIDMYVHNYTTNGAFFSYRDVLEGGGIQAVDNWKGSYEVGSALWGMSLNYSLVSNYQSTHSSQAYNYLDMMVQQIRNAPSGSGYFQPAGYSLNSALWGIQGSPVVAIVEDAGNNVVSIRGNNNHTDLIASVDRSFNDFVFEARVKMTADGNTLCNPAVDFRFTNTSNRYMTQMRGEAQNDLFVRRYQAGVSTDLAAISFNYIVNQYYDYKITASGNSVTPYIDGTSLGTINDNGSTILSGGISLRNYENDYAAYFDDVRVRSYAAVEPVSSFGFEQNQFPPLGITAIVTDVTCNGSANGAIDITVTGGDGTYTYLWSPGGQTTEDITGLSGGTYSVHVEDGNGPVGDMEFTVDEPAPLAVGYSVTHPPVCPGGYATVEITATGGTPPYSGTGIFSQAVGLTDYTVTDANGCQTIQPVTVNLAGAWLATPGWPYRKPVEIANNEGTALTDFQVKVVFDSSFDFDKVDAGGNDIRFTASDGTELPYWIESWNDATPLGTVWVRVPSIPVAGTTIYVYYGNTGATAASNGFNTFLFFDNFSTGTIEASRWSVVGSPIRSIVNYGGNNVLSIRGNSNHTDFLTTVNQSFTDFIFETKALMTADNSTTCQPSVGFRYTSTSNRYITQLRGNSVNDMFIRKYYNGTGYINEVATGNDYNANQFYKYKISAVGNTIRMYLDDVLKMTPLNSGGDVLTGGFNLYNYFNAAAAYFDDVRVRRYAGTEPTAIIGNEESGSTWSGCTDSDWSVPGNWYGGAVPAAGADITVPHVPNFPILSGAFSCNSLAIEPAARMTVSATGALTVAGTLTINSAGTANSGSLLVEDGGTVSGTVIYNRFLRPEDTRGDRHFFSSPVGGQTIGNFTTVNSSRIAHDGTNYQIWSYAEISDSWPIVSSGEFESGQGYNIDQAVGSTGLLTFTGASVNTAEYLATSPYATGYTDRSSPEAYSTGASWSGTRSWTNYGGGGWNLMGNPFTSSMNAGAFVLHNAGSFDPNYEALYIYDGINDEYLYAASTIPGFEGAGSSGPTVQAGQGFFVLALYDQITFEFTPAMQVHGTAVPLLKSGETDDPWPGLKLKVRHGDRERSTLVVYGESTTTDIDPGYDVGQLSTTPVVEVYTSLVAKDNGVNFARQALPLDDIGKIVVPVGIDSKDGGEITFSADVINTGSYKYWLEDRLTGIFTNLSEKNYTVTLPANTFGTGRFYIIASVSSPTAIKRPEADMSGLRVWTWSDQVIIRGEVSDRAVCELIDLSGRMILKRNLTDGELNIVDLPSGMKGVFIVRVMDGRNVTTRKIAVL